MYEENFSTDFLQSKKTLFEWHQRVGAFERLIPPFTPLTHLKSEPLKEGSKISFRRMGIPFHARIVECTDPHRFVDTCHLGPLQIWRHEHLFEGEKECRLVDQITSNYPLPKKMLHKLFQYRGQLLKNDLAIQHALQAPAMRIAVTGARGFIGSALTAFLKTAGHEVIEISRNGGVQWNPEKKSCDPEALEGIDACIHLAGENIGSLRWSTEKKERILQSRVDGIELLLNTFGKMKRAPKTLLIASAVGFYGDRGKSIIHANDSRGEGFLADVCSKIERIGKAFEGRFIPMRFGLVLSPNGGILKKMLTPNFFHLGAVFGSGEQYMSWIALDDLLYQIYFALTNEAVSGPLNLTSPHPVQQKEFVNLLAKITGRSRFLRIPKKCIQSLSKEAGSLLLNSVYAVPDDMQLPYFKFPQLEKTLNYSLSY